jgi:tetratricopeptide (TPR) repeat protein
MRNYSGSRHIHRFYVKRYLNSLWSRNLYARARRLLRDAYVDRKTRVPRTFWPKYVRSTLDIDGPPVARKLLGKLDVSRLPATHELRLLMGLEDALVSFQEGKVERAFDTIRKLERHKPRVHSRHRYRLAVYRALCLQSLGKPMEAAGVLQRELPAALTDGCIDEAVLMQIIGAAITIYGGNADAGLTQIARALRTAATHQLHFRVNTLYRLAASVYVDGGKYKRASRAQMRAIQSSYILGMMDYVAIGWQRLAEYERAMGMFGNAIRCIERARAILADSAHASHLHQVNRLRYEVAVSVKSRQRHELTRLVCARKSRMSDVSERANLEFALGQYFRLEGQLGNARSHFVTAREFAIKAGMVENAVLAAGAEVRALYELGRTREVENPASFVKRSVKESSSVTLRAERCIVATYSAYLSRDKRRSNETLVAEARVVLNDLESPKTRSEIALALFRLHARAGEATLARHWAELYMSELKIMLANLTEPSQAEGVAQLVDMDRAGGEITKLMERAAK